MFQRNKIKDGNFSGVGCLFEQVFNTPSNPGLPFPFYAMMILMDAFISGDIERFVRPTLTVLAPFFVA